MKKPFFMPRFCAISKKAKPSFGVPAYRRVLPPIRRAGRACCLYKPKTQTLSAEAAGFVAY